MGLELKPEIATALTALAAAEGLSVEDYLQMLISKETPAGMPNRHKRQKAAESILELQKHVKPDPDGWTIRDYIDHGRL